MPLVAASLDNHVAHLLVTLLVILHSPTAVTGTLSLDLPLSTTGFGQVDIFESAQNPLLAIVTCSRGPPQTSVNDALSISFGIESLTVQLGESRSKPNEFFLLPNNAGTTLPEGAFHVDVLCGNDSVSATVNINSADFISNQPYFTNSVRTINISASTPPGTVIANYTAEFVVAQSSGYVLHDAFSSAPFEVDMVTGELSVRQSLQEEGILPVYDIVVVADRVENEAWTLTTITINSLAYPECTASYCKRKKNRLCTKSDAEGSCTGKVTTCAASFYAVDERSAPEKCTAKNQCSGLVGEMLKKCLQKWGSCVKKAIKAQYGKTPPELRLKDSFKCLEYPCSG